MEARKQYYLLEIKLDKEELPEVLEALEGEPLPEYLGRGRKEVGKLTFIIDEQKREVEYIYKRG
tara:strand:+ start:1531 stop:1722 length:192 start_codon:yes stop_codon:yes gene_type:complete